MKYRELSEKEMRSAQEQEAKLGRMISNSLQQLGLFGWNVRTKTWFDPASSKKFYPVVQSIQKEFPQGRLNVWAEGKVDSETGKVRTRLQFDFKRNPERSKPTLALKPNGRCIDGCIRECKRGFIRPPKVNVPLLLNRARNRSH